MVLAYSSHYCESLIRRLFRHHHHISLSLIISLLTLLFIFKTSILSLYNPHQQDGSSSSALDIMKENGGGEEEVKDASVLLRPFDLSHLERIIKKAQVDLKKTKTEEDGEKIDIDGLLRDILEEQDKWDRKLGRKSKDDNSQFQGEQKQEVEGQNLISSPKSALDNGENTPIKPKYILYWNEAYGSTKYGFCCGRSPLEEFQCPEKNCHFTDNRTLLSDVSDYDAILFHQRSTFKTDLPEKRSQKQIYIMYMLESADYPMGFESSEWNDFFNLTMTYRTDSDIILPYARMVRIKDLPEDVEKFRKEFGKKNKELAVKRNNKNNEVKAAWFVSNCESKSQREDYVKELKKYIKVDIYGKCGNDTCSRNKEDECWRMVEEEYHFYLAFENSICKDYVTEKFYNVLRRTRNVIPVVLGGADYNELAPEHSFVDATSQEFFSDPKELAKHLKDIVRSSVKYSSFFWWKEFYEIRQSPQEMAKSFCDICSEVNRANRLPKSYEDMNEWWIRKAKCKHVHIRKD